MKKRFSALLFVLPLAASIVSCELAWPKPDKPTMRVLVVALDYSDDDDVKNLEGTMTDAKEVAVALNELAGTVYDVEMETTLMLQGSDPAAQGRSSDLYPTKANIKRQLKSYAENPGILESDIFVLYYSGHGSERDASMVAAPSLDGDVIITASDLSAWTSGIPGAKLIVMDSCYSGQQVAPYPQTAAQRDDDGFAAYDPHAFYLTASSVDQSSYEDYFDDIGHRHGYFTRYFLEAIGWDHCTDYSSTLVTKDIDITVDGRIPDTVRPPAATGSGITGGNIYRYISDVFSFEKGWIAFQTPQTNDGPLDMVLFSEQW